MRSKKGTEIPVPEGFGEGVNVRISGSNIEFTEYLPLLQQAAAAVGIQGEYFSDPHPYSNVQDAERYVRLDREVSGPVHSRDGWAATHDIKLDERGDRVCLELGELDAENHDREVRRILREGQRLWEAAKRDPAVFRAGRYRYQIQEPEHDLRSVEASTVTRTIGERVWEALR